MPLPITFPDGKRRKLKLYVIAIYYNTLCLKKYEISLTSH